MSRKLSCSASSCVNNMGGLCSANRIKISGGLAESSSATLCETYADRSMKNAISNFANMNIFGEVKQVFTKDSIEMSPKISCDAVKCTHNKERICQAENVQIDGANAGDSYGTKCETFIQ